MDRKKVAAARFGAHLRDIADGAVRVDPAIGDRSDLFARLGLDQENFERYVDGRQLPPRDWVSRFDGRLADVSPAASEGSVVAAYEAILADVDVPPPTAGTAHVDEDPDRLDDVTTDPESRAAMRAFLQRAEVRLSTIHRVAGSFLGGAGLLILLPLFFQDGFPAIYGALLDGWDSGADRAAIAAIGAAVALTVVIAIWALWLLLVDLTTFYFTSHTFESASSEEIDGPRRRVFQPRFTLYGLTFPEDEASFDGRRELDRARSRAETHRALIPDHDPYRDDLDRRFRQIWPEEPFHPETAPTQEAADDARRHLLYRQAAAWDLPIAEEVAKTEATLAAHILRIRIVVLRYVKALLIMLTAAFAMMLADGMIAHEPVGSGSTRSLYVMSIIYLLWAPFAAIAVTAPLKWIWTRYRGIGDISDVYRDERLTQFENLAVSVCMIAGVLSLGSALILSSGANGRWPWTVGLVAVAMLVWSRVFVTWKATPGAVARSIVSSFRGHQP